MSKIPTITLHNGCKMPLIGLGMWQSDDAGEVERAVDAALEAGYRHFDIATLYGNEDKLGNALKKWLDAGKVKREELFIVTKLPWHAMEASRVEKFLNASLKKLQLNYIDLYLIHWPVGLQFVGDEEFVPVDSNGKILYDTTTDVAAVWREMEKYVGTKVKSIGISNFNEKQIDRLMKTAKIAPANHQVEVHAYFQNRKVREASLKHGITVCAYGPLGSPGREDGDFGMEWVVPKLLEDPVIMDIATKHRKTAGQVLLRFIVQQDVVAIPKSTNPSRIQQNIDIFDFELSSVDMRRIEALDKGDAGRSFPGFPDMRRHPESPW